MGSWKKWLYGLGVSALQAVGATGSLCIVDADHFNFSHAGLIHLAKAIGASVLIAVFLAFKNPPKE